MKTIILNGSPNKKEMRENRFPKDLEEAFRMGARLSGGK